MCLSSTGGQGRTLDMTIYILMFVTVHVHRLYGCRDRKPVLMNQLKTSHPMPVHGTCLFYLFDCSFDTANPGTECGDAYPNHCPGYGKKGYCTQKHVVSVHTHNSTVQYTRVTKMAHWSDPWYLEQQLKKTSEEGVLDHFWLSLNLLLAHNTWHS